MELQAKRRSTRNKHRSANDVFLEFTSSVEFDHRLWRYDIAGSIAHARALAGAGILTSNELQTVEKALREMASEMRQGRIELDSTLEDIHMNIEKVLTDRIGDTGAKIHTGRSRNDQVALDMRLATREMLFEAALGVNSLQKELVRKAREVSDAVMPGYTHMQHAQPVLLSHHLLAHFWRLDRDMSRILDCYRRTDKSPLGSGAIAGTSYSLDRLAIAKTLGMKGTTENSIDAVSDRDFAAEAAFALALLMVHLGSIGEELVLWSSHEFGFVKIPDGLSGGSSMMPQKANPDVAELVRGKSGRALGDLVAILTLMKSLPLAYNRDLQEDKENLFDVFDTAEASLRALTTLLAEVGFDRVRMRRAAEAGLMTATDLADLLTSRGMPFRKAHGMVRELARRADGNDEEFKRLAVELLIGRAGMKNSSATKFLALDSAIERRSSEGGTSTKSIAVQIEGAEARIADCEKALGELNSMISRVDNLLGLS